MRPLVAALVLAPALALAEAPASEPFPRLGISAAAGFPDGAVLDAVYRPLDFLRLSAGGTWNWFGFGVQGGAGIAPFHWPIDPTLNVEVGHYFDSDMTWVADRGAGVPTELRPLLERIGYSYVNTQLGLELGSSRSFVFFVRAGASYCWTTVHGTTTTTTTDGAGQVITVRFTDPTFRAWVPSAKVGFLFYF